MGGQSLAFQERKQAEAETGHGLQSTYHPAFPARVKDFALLGASNVEIASLLGVSEQAFQQWIVEKPEIAKALHLGREGADAKVARSAYRKTQGYKVKERHTNGDQVIVKERYIPPSDAMITLWLERRQPGRWGDKRLGEVGSAAADLVELIKAAAARGEGAKVIEAVPVKDDADDDPP